MRHAVAHWLRPTTITDPIERRIVPLVQIILACWGLLSGVALLGGFIANGVQGVPLPSIVGNTFFTLGTIVAWWIMRSGYFQAGVNVAATAFVLGYIPIIMAEGLQSGRVPIVLLIIPLTLVGLLATRLAWLLISGLTLGIMIVLLILENQGSPWVGYAPLPPEIGASVIFLFFVVTSLLGLCFDGFRQSLRGALAEAEKLRQTAEAARTQAEQQASDLSSKTRQLEQMEQQLRSLVSTLETPTVTLAPGILLAPLVGMLDAQRLQHLTRRLLHDVTRQRARLLILDLAGVPNLDVDVAQGLVQCIMALRLIGCSVTLTSITAASARQLAEHTGILQEISTARSPQEVLATMQWN